MMHDLEISATSFKEYSPTAPDDGRKGARGQCRAKQRLRERAQAEAATVEDPFAAAVASLAAAEAQLPHFPATDSEDSEDDEDFTPTIPVRRAAHDDEAGTSGAAAPHHDIRLPTPPPVIVAQVTVPDTLAQIYRLLPISSVLSPSSRVDRQILRLGFWLSRPDSRRPRCECFRR